MRRPRFAHLNLSFNPFGELDTADRLAVAVVNLENWPELLQSQGVALQLVADHGRGKSTHLRCLHQLFDGAPYTQLHLGDKPRFERSPLRFVDSIENLSWWRRQRLYRRTARLAVTTHRDLKSELQLAGFKVHTVSVSCVCNKTLLLMFEKRIELARRCQSQPVPILTQQHIEQLRERYGDDIRGMEHHLYGVFQTLESIEIDKL